jgi:alpha-ribazole phosphatase
VSANATTLDLVRHGEIATPGLLCAGEDEPLSDKGLAQMQALKQGMNWDLIVSSPYERCRMFASDLAQHLSIQHIVDDNWREIDFGNWINVQRDAIWESDQQRLLQLWSQPLDFCAPEGEHMVEFVGRILQAFNQLLKVHRGKTILLMTHAGVIRAILANALTIDYKNTQKFSIQHGKINRLRAYPDGEFSLLNWACSASEFS